MAADEIGMGVAQEMGQDSRLTERDKYEQGSKCCQQYSQLTMNVRTLSQQVLIGYAVGIGIFLARADSWPPERLRIAFMVGGIIMFLFAIALWVLNLHHSTAFTAIRNRYLIPLEGEYEPSGKPKGPWQAHRMRRDEDRWLTRTAWHFPYIVLVMIGIASVVVGWQWKP